MSRQNKKTTATKVKTTRKPKGYWDDFANVERELRHFIATFGEPDTLPTQRQLVKAGRANLMHAIKKHGGVVTISAKMGLHRQNTDKPSGYWLDFANVEKELQAFIAAHGTSGIMPTVKEFTKNGRGDLADAIVRKHNGILTVAKRLNLAVPNSHRPDGYWDDFENFKRELLDFIKKHGQNGQMPIDADFRRTKQTSPRDAIKKHGGFSKVAKMLGLDYVPSSKRRYSYWGNFENIKKELEPFIVMRGKEKTMPTTNELLEAGRADLIAAMTRHGGMRSVAQKLGLPSGSKNKLPGYWDDFKNIESAVLKFIKESGRRGVMPLAEELNSHELSGLVRAIIKKHGGMAFVAKKLGLKYSQERRGHWDEFANLQQEIMDFVLKHGISGVMPTHSELANAGYRKLIDVINKHGGIYVVAERLGLKTTSSHKPKYYWENFDNVKIELLNFINMCGKPNIMPTLRELGQLGRSDLLSALSKHGGVLPVAKKLNLKIANPRKPKNYWQDFNNLRQEIKDFVLLTGKTGFMPTSDEIIIAGRSDLQQAIAKHGGIRVVAEKLGLLPTSTHKPQGYWAKFDNVRRELMAYILANGQVGIMPTVQLLIDTGRSDLLQAIAKHGGMAVVAQRLNLTRIDQAKPSGYWKEFSNVETELLDFISEHGKSAHIPTQRELNAAGYSGLARAIHRHGGLALVAKKLNLIYSNKEYITPRTASSVEHTARAIQPLAESNLLSPAQIMVILRRAGLLEFRNQRVVKLGASLARGDHAEIEAAIANLVSGGEEIATETITIEESDDLTAAETEALLGVGLEAGLNPPLKDRAEPDTASEQALIRGLSALGELRLPLDEVLSLLTSKVLWQEFYKRLYAWYGSLDATQIVTAEDVEAAILAAYPEHTANEFVAEASALFTLEVEQAVNFAATLPELGWHGPRLRLHQADAARRMAEVLQGDIAASFILNADDPGMGKSASFLAAVMASDIRTVLLIAPKTVADDTWDSANGEIRRCLPQAKIERGLSKVLAALNRKHSPATLTFFILHYEELLNETQVMALAEKSFDCLCLDEIHFIKQRAGQEPTHRRGALETLRASAQVAVGLTGTPLVNELAEPMSLLQTISQHDPRFDHARLSNRRLRDIADVFEALLPHIVRRRKREVLLHLPTCEVRTVDIPLPADLEAAMLEIYGWPKAQASHALVELRKLATEAKLPYLLERAQAARKLLILTYLTDDVSEKIYTYLDDFFPGQITHINGLILITERQARLDSFRDPNGVRVLVGTIGTIGVGLTLFDPKQAATANEIIVADLPYTWAEFEQGIARLHREGQKQTVQVDIPQTTTTANLRDGSAHHTLDERLWALLEGKRELSDVAIDGKYDTTEAAAKVQKALRRWLQQAREIGVEPLAVERRSDAQSEAQRWRGEIGRLRGMSATRVDEVFADPNYTRQFLTHLATSAAGKLSHQWLRGRLTPLMRPDLVVVDMGCGLNPFADLPCQVIGLDRHDRPGQLRGKMENPPLPDKSADVLIYSLALYGLAADLKRYFTHAARILRGGGHLFIVEPDAAFSEDGLKRFVTALQQFGFELVGTVKELRGEDGTLLKGMHLTLTGELGDPAEVLFERK